MDWRIHLATDLLRRDVAAPLCIDALAARVNLSRSRFLHLFSAEVGVGPARYLRTARLERAAELLVQTRLSVRAVMDAVGCKDPSRFARDFRDLFGESPRAFRTARVRSLRAPSTMLG